MAKTKVSTAIREADAFKSELLEQIEEGLEKIEIRMRPYEKLNEKKQELLAARRALLGGSKLTGSGGKQVRQADIVDFLRKKPGSTPQEIASHFGTTPNAIYNHLNRGRDERFLKKENKWWIRDPKNGINTVDDIEEDDE